MAEQSRAKQGLPDYEGISVAELTAEEEQAKVKGRTQREIIWRRFRRHRLAMVSGIVLVLMGVAAIATPYIAPYDFAEPDFTALSSPPSLAHPMGTDVIGRDALTRVMYGGRVSLAVGLAVGLASVTIGATLGIISGYYGRFVDTGIMSFTDFMIALPLIPVLLVMGRLFQFSPATIAFALSIFFWMSIARIVRGEVLTIRKQEYVQASKAVGVSDLRIMWRHVLPNVVGVLAVQATLVVALAILVESAVSFLGLGIQPPTPSWGNMLSDSRATMTTLWWLTWFPGMMIVITALCVNFLGDGLRDALDPKAVE